MSHLRPARSRRPSPLMAALCTALLLLAGLLRGLVVCTPDDGASHIEFAHAEGQCCGHDAHAESHGDAPACESLRDDATCDHFDLAIPFAPSPQPDVHELPDDAPAIATLPLEVSTPKPRASAERRPPATGPPRPSSLLRQRRTVVLLI